MWLQVDEDTVEIVQRIERDNGRVVLQTPTYEVSVVCTPEDELSRLERQFMKYPTVSECVFSSLQRITTLDIADFSEENHVDRIILKEIT